MLKLGSHTQFEGNLTEMIKSCGIPVIQFFMGSPLSVNRSKISDADLESAKKQQNDSDNQRYQNLENSIKDHVNTINTLNQEISQLKTMKTEYENVKHQVQHVDTFRTELTKTREELNNVRVDNEKIINLQCPNILVIWV